MRQSEKSPTLVAKVYLDCIHLYRFSELANPQLDFIYPECQREKKEKRPHMRDYVANSFFYQTVWCPVCKQDRES